MLFLVAIAFTTIVPLFLYVNNVNNLYNQTADKMREFDHERSLEKLIVYIYPIQNGSALNIHIRNKCSLNVKVVRIWLTVNKTCYTLSDIPALEGEIPPATEKVVSGIALPPGEKTVQVMVTTNRGNVFLAENNPLYVVWESWSSTNPFTVTVVMGTVKPGWIRRTIYIEYIGANQTLHWNKTVEVTQLVTGGYGYTSVGVSAVGTYKLMVWDNKLGYKHDLIYTGTVDVSYTIPSPWVWVPSWEK